MKFVADFHIHSKYSRATSPQMNLDDLSYWAKIKGVDLLGTGDFTHPQWFAELSGQLKEVEGTGLYEYNGVKFILSCEIASIYTQNGKCYRAHNVFLAPSLDVVKKINAELGKRGNIRSDGRPILGLSSIELCEIMFSISEEIMLIPAHIWTPWFSMFGSRSGFDTVEEAFGKYADKITALETGLSSDPEMNWRLSALDKYSLVSNSDCHSPSRIAREANVFDCELNYWEIKKVLETKDKSKFLYTIEFYPEEGKYHLDGHRNCKLCFEPEETIKNNGKCPVCKQELTVGVLNRVNALADREIGYVPENSIPFRNMVPLDEIISAAVGVGVKSKKVQKIYFECIEAFGTELRLLIDANELELRTKLPERIAQGVLNVRNGKVERHGGFDGEYGVIKIFEDQKMPKVKGSINTIDKKKDKEQISLF